MSATPPGWAEALLRVFLKPRDSDSVSGDLLEEYRDSIHPLRGQRKADAWYVTQVLAFVSRRACVWSAPQSRGSSTFHRRCPLEERCYDNHLTCHRRSQP